MKQHTHQDSIRKHQETTIFHEALLKFTQLGYREEGMDSTLIQIEQMVNTLFGIRQAKLHVFDAEHMQRYYIDEIFEGDEEEISTNTNTKTKVPQSRRRSSIHLTRRRVYSEMSAEDDVGACLMEGSQDLSMKWFHVLEMQQQYPEEYNHLEQYKTLCVPVRGHPDLNIIAVLQLPDSIFQQTTFKEEFENRLGQLTNNMSGPLELASRIESNHILAMRRFNGRVAHGKLSRTFTAWMLYHRKLVEGRQQRKQRVDWMQKIKQRHKQTNEFHTLVAWTRFVARNRGEKIRLYQIQISDIQKQLPNEDTDDL